MVSIDPYTGDKTNLCQIPGMTGVPLGPGGVFDPDSSRYIFCGGDSLGCYDYVFDSKTGTIISQTIQKYVIYNTVTVY